MPMTEESKTVFNEFKEVLKVSNPKKVEVDKGVFAYQILLEGKSYIISDKLYQDLMNEIKEKS